jgi:Zn-finger nucleic acid-binding protein
MTYRDDPPTCPACQTALVAKGTRFGCTTCDGLFVRAKEVEEMLRQMSPSDPRTIDQWMTPGGSDAPRPCPRCKSQMRVGVLDGVTIDLCPDHGIWFDARELTRVLDNEQARREPQRPSTSGIWRQLDTMWRKG